MRFALPALTIACLLATSNISLANHPVLVEGESDFDGDGLLGVAEDMDGDRIFGTLTAALGADFGAANQNGRVTIVTSGRFAEILSITGLNGNVTLEGAPGVDANLDAVLAGMPGNVERQNSVGITVSSGPRRSVIIRNLTIRNWREGIRVIGSSHVTIDNCRIEQNLDYGIRAQDNARVAITHTQVIGTGFRVGAAGSAPMVVTPDPGTAIRFEHTATGLLGSTYATGNFGGGLVTAGFSGAAPLLSNFSEFDNNRGEVLGG